MNGRRRTVGLVLALVVIGAAILAIERPWAPQSRAPPAPEDIPPELLKYPAAPDFTGAAGGWINSEPLDLVDLRGKVALVDFWTYSCINCIRTFPYVEAWYERYKDHGFVVVGVHTPEFRFERDIENVRAATNRYGLTYPVALDNEYGVWDAYHNRYWPAEYLIDQYGRIRYTHFGEGGYEQTEATIRELLIAAGYSPPDPSEPVPSTGARPSGVTPELYAAAAQGLARVRIGNAEGYHPGETITYARPATIEADLIYLYGTWQNNDENLTAIGDGASVLVGFRAAAANFVADGAPAACVPVLIDGGPVTRELAGRDVTFDRGEPCIVLDGPRSYDFYAGPFGAHSVRVLVPDGFSLFTFAFSSTEGGG